jgi:hypothetical protein
MQKASPSTVSQVAVMLNSLLSVRQSSHEIFARLSQAALRRREDLDLDFVHTITVGEMMRGQWLLIPTSMVNDELIPIEISYLGCGIWGAI